jgi:hypothetical protein
VRRDGGALDVSVPEPRRTPASDDQEAADECELPA